MPSECHHERFRLLIILNLYLKTTHPYILHKLTHINSWRHPAVLASPNDSDSCASRFISLLTHHNLRYFIITTIKTLQSSFFGRKSLHIRNRYHFGFIIKPQCNDTSSRYLRTIVSAWSSATSISFQLS